MKDYKYLLFDVDDTLLSFAKCERVALTLSLKEVGVKANSQMLKKYHSINIGYWKKVERKEISKEECLILRFADFLPLYNIDVDPHQFEDIYRKYLNTQAFRLPLALFTLKVLSRKYEIYAITNGVKMTQEIRCKKAQIDKYFRKSFISEDIGYNKPDINFYNYVKNNIKDFDPSKALIIGDSLTSDITLGLNAGIDTCYLSNKTNISNIKPTYQIKKIYHLINLLKYARTNNR